MPTLSVISADAFPACTFFGCGGCATIRSVVLAAISSPSRLFHVARTSADGAQPRIPGWMRPGNRTPGICRVEQKMPSKSQIALALESESARCQIQVIVIVRFGIDLIKKSASVTFRKDSSKPPRLLSKRLHVLDFNNKHVAGLGTFDFKRARKIVDLGQIDIAYIRSIICVLDLTAGPTMRVRWGLCWQRGAKHQSRHSMLTASPWAILPTAGTR